MEIKRSIREHQTSALDRPMSPTMDLKIRYKLTEELSVCNNAVRNAAQLLMNQKKTTDTLKNDVHRMKRYKGLSNTGSKAQDVYKEARKELHLSSMRFVSAYKRLQKAVDSAQPLKYRKEYKTAEKSLAELSSLASEAIRALNPQDQQVTDVIETTKKKVGSVKNEKENDLKGKITEGSVGKSGGAKSTTADTSSDEDVDDQNESETEDDSSDSYAGNELDTVDEEQDEYENAEDEQKQTTV